MTDHLLAIGYLPKSYELSTDVLEDTEKTIGTLRAKMDEVAPVGAMVFGNIKENKPEQWYVLFVVDEHAIDLNQWLFAFLEDQAVNTTDRLSIIVNKNDDGSLVAGLIVNPALTIDRQRILHDFDSMTLLMPIVTCWVDDYKGSHLVHVRDQLEGRKVNFGYINRREVEALSKKGSMSNNDVDGLNMVLGFSDFPQAEIIYAAENGEGATGLLGAAMKRIPDQIVTDDVKVIMIA